MIKTLDQKNKTEIHTQILHFDMGSMAKNKIKIKR